MLQGVPQCMKVTAPKWINWMILSHMETSNTSHGDGTAVLTIMSTGGRHLTPRLSKVVVSLAVPENISRKKGPAAATSKRLSGTSFHEPHVGEGFGSTVCEGKACTSFVDPIAP